MCAMDYVRELREANERLHFLDIQHAQNVVLALTGNLVEIRWLEKDLEQGERDLVDDWWSRR